MNCSTPDRINSRRAVPHGATGAAKNLSLGSAHTQDQA